MVRSRVCKVLIQSEYFDFLGFSRAGVEPEVLGESVEEILDRIVEL